MSPADSPSNPQTLTPEALRGLLRSGREVAVIDVMNAERHARCRLPGAKNACVYEVVFPERVREIVPDPATPVALYGAGVTPHDGECAAAKLARLGYSEIYLLEGGLAAWSRAGQPVEGEAPAEAELAAASLRVPDKTFRVDPAACLVEWTGRNAGNQHRGRVNLGSGSLTASGGELSGVFEIDLTSILCYNLEGSDLHPVLVAHLQSDDFFFTALFPKAVFRIVRAAPMTPANLSAPNYSVAGELTVRGATRPLAFAATVVAPPDGSLIIEAHFDFDRTDWGVIYGSSRFFHFLGMYMVFDPISMSVRIRGEGGE
ncbi:MAG: YceI family protein [Desulfovibrionaceae bacterium]|nr:YceI family protein [Desulfovibrionaceae bacterium]MBF0514522.1 YceI family protein [Desulfovibrionaceae bacterium]